VPTQEREHVQRRKLKEPHKNAMHHAIQQVKLDSMQSIAPCLWKTLATQYSHALHMTHV